MPGQVSRKEKETRSAAMISLTDATRKEFLEQQVGRTLMVLFESPVRDGLYEGYSENYTPVRVSCQKDPRGSILPVFITQASDTFCVGELA